MKLRFFIIPFLACLILAQDAPRGFRNPADVAAMTSLVSTSAPSGGSTLTNGLISYWTFDSAQSVTNDAAGTNNLTMVGTVNTASNGIIGKASCHTNSMASYWKINNTQTENLVMAGTTNLTFSVWVYLRGPINVGGWLGFIQNTGTTNGWGCLQNTTGQRYYGTVSTNGTYTLNANILNLDTIDFTNKWYNFVTVQSATNLATYTNGVLAVNNTQTSGGVFNSTRDFILGGYSLNRCMDGLIDEVAVWKTNLSPTQISNVYYAGTNGVGYPWNGY